MDRQSNREIFNCFFVLLFPSSLLLLSLSPPSPLFSLFSSLLFSSSLSSNTKKVPVKVKGPI